MTTWSTLTWTTARAGGMTAYILLTLSMVLGLALSMRWQRPNWPRLITNELHGFLTLLSLVFIGVHTLAVLLDPYIKFGLQDVLVPLATHYRTIWVALGIVGTYVAIAVWISTQLRPLIGFALWRKLHGATFLVYALSTVHGIATGSDTRTFWGMGIYGLSVLAVGALLAARLLQPTKKAADGHPTLAAAALFSMLVGVPLDREWTAAVRLGRLQQRHQAGFRGEYGNCPGSRHHRRPAIPQSMQIPAWPSRKAAATMGMAAMVTGTTMMVDGQQTVSGSQQGDDGGFQ